MKICEIKFLSFQIRFHIEVNVRNNNERIKKLTFTVTVISHSGNVVQYFHYSLDTNSNNVTRTITPRGRRLGCSVRSVRVRVCVCVICRARDDVDRLKSSRRRDVYLKLGTPCVRYI